MNFFNANDYALDKWTTDQNLKPDYSFGVQYHYDGTNFSKGVFPPYTLLLFPVDTYEIFAYCDEARCYALGAQPNVGGAFNGKQVDLQTVWPLDTHPQGSYKDHVWHSAEFRSDNIKQGGFWNVFLGSQGFSLK